MRIDSIMTTRVVTVDSHTPLLKVAAVMASRTVSCVLVTRADKAVGIITERDLVRQVANSPDSFKDKLARDVMTSPLGCISPSMTLIEAVELMQGRHYRHLPVADANENLLGMVTQTDLVRAFMELQRGGAN